MSGYVFWVTVILVLFGLAMVYSTASSAGDEPLSGVKKQAVSAPVGLCAMLLLPRPDHHRLPCLNWRQFYILSTALLVVTLVLGRSSYDRTRWIRLGSVNFQLSELIKAALVLFLTVHLANYYYSFSKTPKRVFQVMAVFGGIPAGLTAFQNLNTSLLLSATVLLIILLSVKDNRIYLGLTITGTALLFFAVYYYKKFPLLHPYQIARIESWLSPDTNADGSGSQVRLGRYTISADSWSGADFGRGVVKQNGLPEPLTDFIFPVIGKELGMVGMSVLTLFYAMPLFCVLRITCHTPDRYGALLYNGVTVHILLYIVVHVAVVTGLMPNTGVTLPFISSGGTSLTSFMGEIGLVLTVPKGMRPEQLT